MAKSVERLLVTQLVNLINENNDKIGLPCGITIGVQTFDGEAMWLQALGGTKLIKQYIRGRYLGEFPFVVYYRLSMPELAGIEAKMFVPFEKLADWFDDNQNSFILDDYVIKDITMTRQPAPMVPSADGTIIYQAHFNFKYSKER